MLNLYSEETFNIIDKIIEEDDVELNWQAEVPNDQTVIQQEPCDPVLERVAELFADINVNLEEILGNFDNFKDDSFFKSNLILNLENIVENLVSLKESMPGSQQIILSIPLA